MLVLNHTRLGIRVAEVFFATSVETNRVPADVVHFIQAKQAPSHAQPFETLVIGLGDLSAVLAGMRKQTRYEIRRAERQDALECSLTITPTQEDLDGFIRSFEVFATAKGISPANVGRLDSLRRTGNLALSQASSGAAVVARHAYIIYGGRARLLHSCSAKPTDDPTLDRAAAGRANRYLHWFDMCSLRSSSFESYDLGGVSSGQDPRLAGIDDFKAGFGGQRIREYNLTTSKTARGALALFLSNRALDGR